MSPGLAFYRQLYRMHCKFFQYIYIYMYKYMCIYMYIHVYICGVNQALLNSVFSQSHAASDCLARDRLCST